MEIEEPKRKSYIAKNVYKHTAAGSAPKAMSRWAPLVNYVETSPPARAP
jgi:hypothetical protein